MHAKFKSSSLVIVSATFKILGLSFNSNLLQLALWFLAWVSEVSWAFSWLSTYFAAFFTFKYAWKQSLALLTHIGKSLLIGKCNKLPTRFNISINNLYMMIAPSQNYWTMLFQERLIYGKISQQCCYHG